MPVSKKPRRKHRPVPYRMPSVIRYSAEQETALQLIPHVSLDLFRSGHATESDWHTLAARISWCSVLASRHQPQDVIDVAQAGVVAMREAFARHERAGRWGFSGEELRAVGAALNLMDELQVAHTRKELLAALQVTLRVGSDATPGQIAEVAL